MWRTFLLLLFPITSIGQTINLTSSCSYYGEKLPNSTTVSFSDYEAQNALTKILSASGLPTNFTLVSGNIPNACATVKYNEATKSLDRYIIYNTSFMNRVKAKTNDWAALSILAHEVGHHLSGHSLRIGGSRPDLELEADKFSGFILQKLGASLEEAMSAINLLTTTEGSSTHPSKFLRLSAIREGWFNAKGKNPETINEVQATKPPNVGTFNINGNQVRTNDVYITKTSDNSFDITCEGYKFNSNEYSVFDKCENLIVYLNDYKKYLYLENFHSKPISSTPFKLQQTCPGICNSNHILVKASNGYWILYLGKNVKVLESNSYYSDIFGYVYRMQLENGATVDFEKYKCDRAASCSLINPLGHDN